MKNTDRQPVTSSGIARTALLSAAVVVAFGLGLTAQVGADGGLTVVTSALAANGNSGNSGGNGGGNGTGGGKDTAPGQQLPIVSGAPAPGDEVVDALTEDGGETATTEMPVIAEDAPPATIEVVKELAGLPDESALSEEEELEAIRTGWGTWRTATGQDTVMSQ